jgi:hypothetical protein
MSLQVVMPPRSISAPASRLPSRTKAGRRVSGLGGPDGFLQPAHQRQVVGEAAHQGHGGVGVQVDQSGGDDVLREADGFRRRIEACLVRREDVDDASAPDGDAVMFQRGVVRLDRE